MSQKCSQDTINAEVNKRLKNSLSSTSDLQQQAAINQALTDAGLPQNKINSLIELAKERLMCDSACQKEKKKRRIKEKTIKSTIKFTRCARRCEFSRKKLLCICERVPSI